MRAALLLIALAATASAGEEPARLSVTLELGATLAVGQPIALQLEARAPLAPLGPDEDALSTERRARAELRARFGSELFEADTLDYSWVLLDSTPLIIHRTPAMEAGAELIAKVGFRLVSLEAGERELPCPAFAGEVAPLSLTFLPALVEGEDQPRPLLGFRELPPEPPAPSARPWWPAASVGGVLLLLALGAFFVRRRRARARTEAQPDPRVGLGRLVAKTRVGGAAAMHAAHFELTALLRTGFEGTLEPRATLRGATDEERLEARRAELSSEEATELADWFAGCAAVKYGGVAATEWGLNERVERATALLSRRSR